MVKKLILEGGQKLGGTVNISGAKNAVTKLMIASLLTDEPVELSNVPHIGDVDITLGICQQVGTQAGLSNHVLQLHTPTIKNTQVKEQTLRNRLSVLALGPLLHRTGEAELPIVGGDNIGARPVNYHLDGLRQMGAQITESKSGYHAKTHGLKGVKIQLPYPSVGATENLTIAATLATGRTVITGAATEPEIVDLISMLQQMGAVIKLGANRTIVIDGVKSLHGTSYAVMPDRLEAAAYAVMALSTDSQITVAGAKQADLITFLNTLRRVGGDYVVNGNGISFKRSAQALHAIEVRTDVWPGFSTDWQQPLAVLLTQAKGKSYIHETVYPNRFGYVEDLQRMGAQIDVFDARQLPEPMEELDDTHYSQSIAITGPTKLKGTNLEIPDIRAGMAHVIAALVAEGESTLIGIEHLLRGYDEVLDKLRSIGARFISE